MVSELELEKDFRAEPLRQTLASPRRWRPCLEHPKGVSISARIRKQASKTGLLEGSVSRCAKHVKRGNIKWNIHGSLQYHERNTASLQSRRSIADNGQVCKKKKKRCASFESGKQQNARSLYYFVPRMYCINFGGYRQSRTVGYPGDCYRRLKRPMEIVADANGRSLGTLTALSSALGDALSIFCSARIEHIIPDLQ